MISRRGFLFGIGASLAVIRTPGLIMPVKAFSNTVDAIVVTLEEPLCLTQYMQAQVAELMERRKAMLDGYLMRVHPKTYEIFTEALEPGWQYAGVEIERPLPYPWVPALGEPTPGSDVA